MLAMGTGDLLKESLSESGDVITGGEGRKKERKSLGNVVRLLQYRILVDNPRLDGMFTGFMRTRSGGNPEVILPIRINFPFCITNMKNLQLKPGGFFFRARIK